MLVANSYVRRHYSRTQKLKFLNQESTKRRQKAGHSHTSTTSDNHSFDGNLRDAKGQLARQITGKNRVTDEQVVTQPNQYTELDQIAQANQEREQLLTETIDLVVSAIEAAEYLEKGSMIAHVGSSIVSKAFADLDPVKVDQECDRLLAASQAQWIERAGTWLPEAA